MAMLRVGILFSALPIEFRYSYTNRTNIANRLQQSNKQLWISDSQLSFWLKYIRLKIRDFYSFCVCFSLSNFSPFWRVFRTLQWKFWVLLPSILFLASLLLLASLLMLILFLASLLLLVSLLLRVSFLLLTFIMFILLLSTQLLPAF